MGVVHEGTMQHDQAARRDLHPQLAASAPVSRALHCKDCPVQQIMQVRVQHLQLRMG